MTMGTVIPLRSLVWSLNCLTNMPMFTPCWPSAGPTGGAGVACPPGHCNLICAVTCFAISIDPHERIGRPDPMFAVPFSEPLLYDPHGNAATWRGTSFRRFDLRFEISEGRFKAEDRRPLGC